MFKDNTISSTIIVSPSTFPFSKTPWNWVENGMFFGVEFTGKETDWETGLSYFGARYYNPTLLTSWTAVDPMADKYPSLSPYNYCAWNPMKLVDPDGEEVNPIYDLSGSFLGTDDLGLQGDPIIMNRSKFKQGMSHTEALKVEASLSELVGFCNSDGFSDFLEHSGSLSSRPDWDGVVTREEGIAWAKKHPGALAHPTPDNTLYIDASKLDFGNITISDFKNGIGEDSRIQTLNAGNFVRGLKKGRLQNTVYALGRVNLILLNGAGDVKVVNNEATDYDWNKGGGFIRNTLIMGERITHGLNDNHGFKTYYYGAGKVKK